MKNCLVDKINTVLLWVTAFCFVVFFILIECFNDLSLDDIGFFEKMNDIGIYGYIKDMYFNWQGRFAMFFQTAIHLKTYSLFHSQLPFSIVVFLLNILFIAKACQLYARMSIWKSFLYAIILHAIYFMCMFETASYFWICTKPYTLVLSSSVYLMAYLYANRSGNIMNNIVVLLISVYIGASYEIYSPVMLVFMGCWLLCELKRLNWDLRVLILEYPLLVMSFFVMFLSFVIMLVAPGNWNRMDTFAEYNTGLDLRDYVQIIISRMYMISKYLLYNIPYLISFVLVFAYMLVRESMNTVSPITFRKLCMNIIVYCGCFLILVIISILLNTYATGQIMIDRATNHILVWFFMLCTLIVRDCMRLKISKSVVSKAVCVVLCFLCIDAIYMCVQNTKEILRYKESERQRLQIIEYSKNHHYAGVLSLKPLYKPQYHSLVEDICSFFPSYNRHTYQRKEILKPNEVYDDPNCWMNQMFKDYYKLEFDVKTNIPAE